MEEKIVIEPGKRRPEKEGGGSDPTNIIEIYNHIPAVREHGERHSHPRFFPGNYVFVLPWFAKFKVSYE